MPLVTLSDMRTEIMSTVRENQNASLFTGFINLSLQEIFNSHLWTWRRRKSTITTVVSQESYNLDEEVDIIAVIRQRTTPVKLVQMEDETFYNYVPNLEDLGTGSPLSYRFWEETGFSTNITTAEALSVVSSSAADGASFFVRITGRDSNGLVVSENITLNGITAAASSNTYASLLSISKSARTTGIITVSGGTTATVFCRLAPTNMAPRFKRISLYPVPSAAITLYLEYYEVFRELVNDYDIPQMDIKWWWVGREGALARAWEYKQNDQGKLYHQQNFLRGLEQMKAQDKFNPDLSKVMRAKDHYVEVVRRYSDSVSDGMPSYGVGWR